MVRESIEQRGGELFVAGKHRYPFDEGEIRRHVLPCSDFPMSLTRLSTTCAAALLLLAAPLTAQDAAPAASPAPARDSLVTKPISAADREKFAGDYDILLPNGWIMATLIYVEEDQLMIEPEGPGPAQSSGRLWVPGR